MNSTDSATKIITQYFAAVTTEPFVYRGKEYTPKDLRVSPGIFTRTMICVANCGACCRKLTLDLLPGEELHSRMRTQVKKGHMKEHMVEFNGKEVPIMRDAQKDNDGYYCRHLRRSDGRCKVHSKHPFSCDFELLRFSMFTMPDRPNQLTHRPYGRGWNMKVIDGTRGARCEWNTKPKGDPKHQKDVVRKLRRLKDWTDHFGLETCLPDIIEWVESGPHADPLICSNAQAGDNNVN